jgi:hypothetical protein
MKFIDNLNYNNVDECLDYLKNNPYKNYCFDEEIPFHVFWRGKIKRKQLLCINSYLYSQNLGNTKLYVWLDSDYKENSKLIKKHPNIIIKNYDAKKESLNTPFENKNFINNQKYVKFRSDIARLMILFNYGGIYFDLDIILLKDINCILDLEFCYQWGGKTGGNNAFLRLKKGSKNCTDIMNRYVDVLENGCNHTNKYGNDFKYQIGMIHEIFNEKINILCFPSAFFDPVWILDYKNLTSKYSTLNKFDNFFKKTNEKVNISSFFGGNIMAYHWHSRNNQDIEENSFYSIIEKEIYMNINLKKYISFSLWCPKKPLIYDGSLINRKGDEVINYLEGAIENLKLQNQYFKDWKFRFYIDNSVPKEYINKILLFGGEIVDMSNSEIPGMYWRFLIMDDPKVDLFIVRDTDSRINFRDEYAINQWLKSNKILHICRDHPHHYYKMLGGMWGFKNYLNDDKSFTIKPYILFENQKKEFKKMDDIYFLEKVIYPKYNKKSFIHDQFFKYETHSITFFNSKLEEYYEYIGVMCNNKNENIYLDRDKKLFSNYKDKSNKWFKYFR